jgi:hypothetical protein
MDLQLEKSLQNGYNRRMNGPSEAKQTVPVTAAQLESLALDLLHFAERLRTAAKVAKTQPNETLAVYNWLSVPTGLRMLRSFVARADESRSAAELGRPLEVGQLKPRSTANKAPTAKEAKAMADKAFGKTKKKKEPGE